MIRAGALSPPAPGAAPQRLGDSGLHRTELVTPGMCGHNSLFVGRIGDWTWDAVAEVCDTDVLRARSPEGAPTYLSFYYYRLRGSRRFHPRSLGFGDRLRIASRVFGFGSESVLTLHRITRTPAGQTPEEGVSAAVEPDEFYAFADDRALYVENFNRWVTRSRADSNEGLLRSSPPDFRHEHLPPLPEAYSPRLACHTARTRGTFAPDKPAGFEPLGREFMAEYAVDPSRDLNGAGLLYFASYFSIVDWALLRHWRALGRPDAAFLDRIVLDQRLCYLGNADHDAVLSTRVRAWHRPGDPSGTELLDVVLDDARNGRALAVCTLTITQEAARP
ncbi:LnmK family bifunctional acyltransferase/decarboxylase [Streptomyces sp. NPDC054844]